MPKYKFYKCLMSKIHLWVWAMHDININNAPPNRYTCKYNRIPDQNVFHHIRNDTYEEWLQYRHKLQDTDLVFATDSSSKNKLTGVGLCCVNLHSLHTMHQPIGSATNNYGELYAIKCCSDYINARNIDTSDRRIIIFTDSLYNFLPLLTTPIKFQKKITYPKLFNETQKFLIENKVILWKIKSHTDPIHWFNDCADKEADKGRIDPRNHKDIIPDRDRSLRTTVTQFDFNNPNPGQPDLVSKLARQLQSTCDLEQLFDPDWG